MVAADSVLVSKVELRWIASETNRMLDGLSRDVRECKNVMLASLCARWLQFSGLLAILERESGGNIVIAPQDVHKCSLQSCCYVSRLVNVVKTYHV